MRALVEAIRFQVRGRVFGKSSAVPIGQRSFLMLRPGRGHSGLAYANPLEWREIRCWQATLRPGSLFIDVGANVGSYSLMALERGAEVIAIEPNAEARSILTEALELNGYEATVLPVALADRSGLMAMTAGLGVLNHLVVGESVPGSTPIEVRTLDEVLGERVADGVKVDVEGFEHLVLRGAARALAEKRIKLLQLEWNTTSTENAGETREATAAYLTSFGYRLFRPGDDGVLHPAQHSGPGPDVFAMPECG